jgi:hypothetical protein
MSEPRWDLVALAVGYRRRQLGLDVDAAAARIGVTPDAWRVLEGGGRPSGFHRDDARRASVALGWTADSLERVVHGQRPIDAAGAPPTLARSARPPGVPGAPATTPTTATAKRSPGKSAPWFLRPLTTKGSDGIRSVDPTRVGVLGGLVIMAAVVLVYFEL